MKYTQTAGTVPEKVMKTSETHGAQYAQIDLPTIFLRLSLLCTAEADSAAGDKKLQTCIFALLGSWGQYKIQLLYMLSMGALGQSKDERSEAEAHPRPLGFICAHASVLVMRYLKTTCC